MENQDRASKFIVSLSHEMKAPLTTVVALADLLGMNDRGNLHPDQIERISVVQQNADRLALLVNDFLNISKMEAGTFKINPSKFQISELAYDLKTSFEPNATGQDHNLDVTASDEHKFATADREILRQAIINLLSNASKYSPPPTPTLYSTFGSTNMICASPSQMKGPAYLTMNETWFLSHTSNSTIPMFPEQEWG